MEQNFYTGRLAQKFGRQVPTPPTSDRTEVHRIIYGELCRWTIQPKSREIYRRVMAERVAQGAQDVILGCAEITRLVGADDATVPVFDTTRIHTAVDWRLAEGETG